jgi:hypothetical protein
MAFNNPHWGTINSGQSFPVAITFGGQNRGAVFFECLPENPGGDLITSDFRIINRNNALTYQITLRNVGANTSFSLNGGFLT